MDYSEERGASDNKLPKINFLRFTLDLLNFERYILSCNLKNILQLILKKMIKPFQHDRNRNVIPDLFQELKRNSRMCLFDTPIQNYLSKGKEYAFTLAEVLITLGVIGLVAAMTLPAVINNAQDRQFHAQWKKAYSVIANAYNLAYEEYPIYFDKIYGNEKTTAAKEFYYNIFSRLNTYDYCVVEAPKGKVCPPTGQGIMKSGIVSPPCNSLNNDKIKTVNAGCMYNGAGGVAFLNDGTIIYAHGYLWDYPSFLVDVNGKKGPNIVGHDMYVILFEKTE